MTTYGLLIFDGAEELDFTGPWEVFTASSMLRDHADTVRLIAERPDAVRCNKGMRQARRAAAGSPPTTSSRTPCGPGSPKAKTARPQGRKTGCSGGNRGIGAVARRITASSGGPGRPGGGPAGTSRITGVGWTRPVGGTGRRLRGGA